MAEIVKTYVGTVQTWPEAGTPGPPGNTGPAGPPGTPGTNGTNGTNGATGATGAGVAAGGTTGQVLAKLSSVNYDTGWQTPGSSSDATKADKATAIATTAPLAGGGDLSTSRTLTIANFAGSAAGVVPVSPGGTTNFLRADGTWSAPAGGGGADATKADKTTTISTTAPLTGGGDLSADRTLAISDFTASSRGAVPNPSSSSGRFLKDDGTWDSPASVISGAGGVFPYMLSTTATEPPTGSQIRGNNATFTSSTKLWITEVTVDGLDVGVGLGRIKAGFQVYIQDYDNSAVFAIFNVTADSTDSGTYREVTVAIASSAGTIPAGKVALQTLSAAQAGNLFSTTTSAKGLAPGSSGGGASVWLNGAAGWTAPTKTDVGLSNVNNTSDAGKPVSTAQQTALDLKQDKWPAVNVQTGTTYTLAIADNGATVTLSNAGAITVTVPTNASVGFIVGTVIQLVQLGAGQVTMAPAGGVTISKSMPTLKFRAQYSVMSIVKVATDVWVLTGDAAAT